MGGTKRRYGSNMITRDESRKLKEFRELVFFGIRKALEVGLGHKSYEGTISVHFPSYFGGDYYIELDCYLLGPARHYSWRGKDLSEAIDKAAYNVNLWINDVDKEEKDEPQT